MALTERQRSSLLSVTMLALLGLSVGAAWLVVQNRYPPVGRGLEILEGIRREGLSAVFDRQDRQLIYIGRNAQGRPTAWSVAWLQPSQEGAYAGRRVVQYANASSEDNWALSADAARGEYRSLHQDARGRTVLATRIVLADEMLQVTQQVPEGMQTASSAAPANYLPEGLDRAVIRQVADSGRSAVFKMILDDQAILGNRIVFINVVITPLEQRKVSLEYQTVQGTQRVLCTLDDSGRIVRQEMPGGAVFTLATRQELMEAFPGVRLPLMGPEPEEPELDSLDAGVLDLM